METKANHIAVGSFVLLAVAGLIAFIMWLGKAEIDREFDRYYVYFRGSVSGLSVASTVRYRGVPVGSVTDIRIDPENSERVRVEIEVTRGTPIKEDSVASLELQGITGLVDVQISGGSKESPALKPKKGKKFAVIPSKPSKLEELFEDIPNLMARAIDLVDRGSRLLSDENLDAIGETLQNMRDVTANVAASTDALETLSADISTIAAAFRTTAERVDRLVLEMSERLPALADETSTTLRAGQKTMASIGGAANAITGDAQETLRAVRDAAEKLSATADQLNQMVAENRPGLRDFSRDGLYELTRFMVEARDLVANLARISERLEADPARFIFGDAQAGFRPQ